MEERWALMQDTIAREVGEKVFIILGEGSLHILENASATTLWKALRGAPAEGVSIRGLAEALVAVFEVDRETATRDVGAFLTRLRELGVVAPARPK